MRTIRIVILVISTIILSCYSLWATDPKKNTQNQSTRDSEPRSEAFKLEPSSYKSTTPNIYWWPNAFDDSELDDLDWMLLMYLESIRNEPAPQKPTSSWNFSQQQLR